MTKKYLDSNVEAVSKNGASKNVIIKNGTSGKDVHPSGEADAIGTDILGTMLQWVNPVTFENFEGEKLKSYDYYVRSIESLLKTAMEHGFDLGKKNGTPYVFNAYYWQCIDKDVFRHFLEDVGVKQVIPYNTAKNYSFVDKLEKQFSSDARFPISHENNTPKINLLNGTLHFTSDGMKLEPFNMRDGLTHQLGYYYDPSAKAPFFEKFLNRVLPNIAVQKVIFQGFANVFLKKKLEKILFLYGKGANGKSTLLNIFRALVGKAQCCEYSLEGITGSEYQRAEISKYLLNISTEISTTVKNVGTFKKLVSREPLQARVIREQPFITYDYAESIFSMNELPKIVEKTDAVFRRLLLIPFDVRIPDDEQDPDLAQKIIDTEMSGVLNRVIEGVQSLMAEGKYDIPDVVHRAVAEYQQGSDNVLSFLQENDYRPDPVKFVILRDLFNDYREQCSSDGSKAVDKNTFARQLRDLDYTVKKHGHNNRTVVFTSREVSDKTERAG